MFFPSFPIAAIQNSHMKTANFITTGHNRIAVMNHVEGFTVKDANIHLHRHQTLKPPLTTSDMNMNVISTASRKRSALCGDKEEPRLKQTDGSFSVDSQQLPCADPQSVITSDIISSSRTSQ